MSDQTGSRNEIQKLQEQLRQLEAQRGDMGEADYLQARADLESRLKRFKADHETATSQVDIQTGDIKAAAGGVVNLAGRDIIQNFYGSQVREAFDIPSDLPPYTRPLGRDSELGSLYKKWKDGARRLLVYGARGMGKACLARALAHKIIEDPNRPRFHACLWWSAGYSKEYDDLLNYLRAALSSMVSIDPNSLSSPEGIYNALRMRPCLLVITKIRRRRHKRLIDFLDGIPGSSTVVLTSTTPIARWSSEKLQKLSAEAALDMLLEKARLVGCDYILQAPPEKRKLLCDLSDGSPVALDMVIKVFQGENPDIDKVLEDLSTGRDAFRTLCAIAYEELSETAQQAFALVCLSHTSFSAQTILSVLDFSKDQLEEALSELTDAGLVSHTFEMDFEQRRFYPAYRLVREYYQKVVRNSKRKVHRALTGDLGRYYLAQCRINGGENWQGHTWLETEILEVLAVIEGMYQRREWDRYFALLDAIYYFLGVRGYWRQKRDLGLQAAQAARLLGESRHEAHALVRVAGWSEIQMRLFPQAETHLQEGLRIYQELQDAGGRASALRYLGTIKRRADDLATAIELYQASIQACEELPAPSRQRLQAGIQVSLSTLQVKQGRLKEARQLLEEALTTFKSLGNLSKIAEVNSRLGDLDLLEGDLDSAEAHFNTSDELARQTGRSKTRAYNHLGLARLHAMRGDDSAAIQLAEEARKLFSKLEIADETGELTELLKLLESRASA